MLMSRVTRAVEVAEGARLHPQGGHGAGGDLEVLQEVQATEHAGGEEVQGAPLEG